MDLRRRSARHRESIEKSAERSKLYDPAPDSNPGVVSFSHLPQNRHNNSRGRLPRNAAAAANGKGINRGRPQSAHQVSFATSAGGGGGGYSDAPRSSLDVFRPQVHHQMHYPAPPSLPRGFIHSQLAPNSSYFSGSQRSSNSSQKQQPLRPMSAHSRVQRGSFQQQAPRIIPYGKDEMDDDDLDCIFDDDQTGFIETDLDQVRARALACALEIPRSAAASARPIDLYDVVKHFPSRQGRLTLQRLSIRRFGTHEKQLPTLPTRRTTPPPSLPRRSTPYPNPKATLTLGLMVPKLRLTTRRSTGGRSNRVKGYCIHRHRRRRRRRLV